MQRGIKNVFDKWKEDSRDMKLSAFKTDCEATTNFQLVHLAKSPQDIDDTIRYLQDHYDIFKVFYRAMMRRSHKYPVVDYDTMV